MSREREPHCPSCGSKDIKVQFECTDYMVSHRQFPIAKCAVCAMRITLNAPGSEEISRYYESEQYISHSGSGEGITGFLYSRVRSLMLGRKAALAARSVRKSRGVSLDIGAGAGFFVRKMRDRGWHANGVEVSDTARRTARELNGVELYESLEKVSFPNGQPDVVTLWHVLEHMHSPAGHLARIASLIKDDGCVIIALPNPDSADARHYGKNWAAWDVPRHLWHFSSESIKRMAADAGLKLRSVRLLPPDSFYISILSEKTERKPFALLRGLVRGFLFFLHSLINKERGSSLIYLFEKAQERHYK